MMQYMSITANNANSVTQTWLLTDWYDDNIFSYMISHHSGNKGKLHGDSVNVYSGI